MSSNQSQGEALVVNISQGLEIGKDDTQFNGFWRVKEGPTNCKPVNLT